MKVSGYSEPNTWIGQSDRYRSHINCLGFFVTIIHSQFKKINRFSLRNYQYFYQFGSYYCSILVVCHVFQRYRSSLLWIQIYLVYHHPYVEIWPILGPDLRGCMWLIWVAYILQYNWSFPFFEGKQGLMKHVLVQ